MFSFRSLRFVKRISVRHASSSVGFYQADPVHLLSSFPDDMTILAYRASKDFIHYSHAQISNSTNTIRILESKPFSLMELQTAPSQVIGAAANQVQECIVQDGNADREEDSKSKRRKSMMDMSAVVCSTVSRIIDESPTADAYLVERIPANTMKIKDRTILEMFSNISRYTEVLRAQLVTKWRKERGEDQANGEPSPIGAEPIFESSGRFVDRLFDVRKSDTVCESLIPIVKRLPYGYPTTRGVLKAEIPNNVLQLLYGRAKGKKGETQLMENHLLCAVILESVAFAKYLLDARRKFHVGAQNSVRE